MADINNPESLFALAEQEKEGHIEPFDVSMKSAVKDAEHPIFSSSGAIETINFSRKWSNTKEKELSGEIPDKVFSDLAKASAKTKVPPDFLLFMIDWENDLTSRSDASDAESIARKMLGYVNELRSTLGRDPQNSEVFMAYVFNGAAKVKKWHDLAKNSPEEEAKPEGTKKDDIVFKKLRNGKEVKRVNREVYDFFYKRISVGRMHFKEILGKETSYQ